MSPVPGRSSSSTMSPGPMSLSPDLTSPRSANCRAKVLPVRPARTRTTYRAANHAPFAGTARSRDWPAERVLDRFESSELDGPRLAVHLLNLADIDVLHDVASARVDRYWSARAFPFHALHGGDHCVGVGLAAGLLQRLVDQVHAIGIFKLSRT